jgi:uncharacterized membrane protein
MFQDTPQQPDQPEQPQAPAEEGANPQPEQAKQSEQPQKPAAPQAPPPPPPVHPVKTTQEERMWAAIGYVAFLGIVTLAMVPKSDFCKKHAAQGLFNFVIWFIGLILFAAPSFVSAIGGIILLGTTIIAIVGILKSIQSVELKLPVFSDIAAKIPTDSIMGSVTGKTPEKTEKPAEKKPEEGEAKPPAEEQKPEQPQEPEQPEKPEDKPSS